MGKMTSSTSVLAKQREVLERMVAAVLGGGRLVDMDAWDCEASVWSGEVEEVPVSRWYGAAGVVRRFCQN